MLEVGWVHCGMIAIGPDCRCCYCGGVVVGRGVVRCQTREHVGGSCLQAATGTLQYSTACRLRYCIYAIAYLYVSSAQIYVQCISPLSANFSPPRDCLLRSGDVVGHLSTAIGIIVCT
jgi:hypothetical protein